MLKVVGPKRDYYDTAYFGWIKYEAEPKAAAEIKKALDLSEKVLRYIIVKTIRENTIHGYKFVKDGKMHRSTSRGQKSRNKAGIDNAKSSINR